MKGTTIEGNATGFDVVNRARQLEIRREALVARAARQRDEFGADAEALALRLAVADRLVALGRSGPVRTLAAVGATLLLAGRPRWLLRAATRLLVLYPVLRPIVVRLWALRPARRARDVIG